MGIVELLLTAVGLSMDAFAVSICKGLGMRRLDMGRAALIALFFGGFQALMPLAGWALGSQFAHYVTAFSHWIAFALLALIGTNMVREALHEDESDDDGEQDADALDLRELTMLAVATSIDAFAVGLSLAFLDADIIHSVTIIGIVTFAISFIGVAIGHQFGRRWEKPSTLAGGIVLILIGVKIVLDGLGVLPF